jgi:hypothetical protein
MHNIEVLFAGAFQLVMQMISSIDNHFMFWLFGVAMLVLVIMSPPNKIENNTTVKSNASDEVLKRLLSMDLLSRYRKKREAAAQPPLIQINALDPNILIQSISEENEEARHDQPPFLSPGIKLGMGGVTVG